MRRRHYDPYRGRGRLRTFLKVLIIVLLVLLAVAVVAFFRMDRNLVISADGYRLDFSGSQQEETPERETPEVGGKLPLIVETSAPDPVPEEVPVRGILLSREALYDGTAESQVAAVGGNAAIFDMKADDGSLGYLSEQPLAVQAGVSNENPAINGAIRGLNAGELYTIARVSCFRDDTVPYYNNSTAIRSGTGNWRDSGNMRWLNPTSTRAREYLVGVCVELAKLGFDEILLDHAGCPSAADGAIDHIVWSGTEDPEQAVEEFYAQVAQALTDYPDVCLSVVSSRTVLTGGDDASGQSVALLGQYTQRVWGTLPAEGDFRLPEDVDGLQMVWMVSDIPENVDNWAIWPIENM